MAVNRKYKDNKRKINIKTKLMKFTLLIAIMTFLVLFVFNYYDNAKNNFYYTNYPQKYEKYVEKAAKDYDLEPALIYAVIRTESNFNPDAHSGAGACGIMQIMPTSFEWLQKVRDCEGKYTEGDLYNPKICIDYGSYLLRYFLDYYGTEQLAVAAYNAGFVVTDWINDYEYSSDGVTLEKIPYPETEKYVERVSDAKNMYIELYYS